MPSQDRARRLTAADEAAMRRRDDDELRRRDAQTEEIIAMLQQRQGASPAPSLRDMLFPRASEVPAPTDAQRAAHEARVRDAQAEWGPVRRRLTQAMGFAGKHGSDFLGGALWGDPTDLDVSRANLLGQMLTAGVPLVGGLKRVVSRVANPIRAYHGSSHNFSPEPGAPLGRFRSSQIGTGHGAQAYGHGLYFADKEGAAQAYRRGLSRRDFSRKVSEVYGEFDAPDDAVRALQEAGLSDAQLDLVKALQDDDWLGFDYPHQAVNAAMSSKVMNWDPSPATLAAVKRQGHTYEVNIHADPDDFLDWDAPLSQQSARVQEILAEKGIAPRTINGGAYYDPPGAVAYSALGKKTEAQALAGPEWARSAPRPENASEALRGLGIPGIKYLDQGSRAAGKGTSNYVVFDDSLIEILKKYGVSLPVIEGLRRQAEQNDGAVDITGVL